MPAEKTIYIDTDISLGTPGAEIDDAAALMMLLGNAHVHIAGIGSVFGNVPAADTAMNLARFIKFFKCEDIQTGYGAEQPIVGNLAWFDVWKQGYEKTIPFAGKLPKTSSCDLLTDCINTFPNQICILALGPMTNIALAIDKSPDIIPKVREVITMGGSFGENSEIAEFNIHCDPVAADRVIHAGWPVTLLGLEVTRKAIFTKAQFMALNDFDPVSVLLKKQAPGWIDRVTAMGWENDGCALHDAVAAAYLLNNELFTIAPAEVEVSLSTGESWGKTTISATAASTGKIRIVKEMDVNRCRGLIWEFVSNHKEQ